jgi:uncharacterized membrane protein YozB (DUF420 family)
VGAVSSLPALNASLNAAASVLLLIGYLLIRHKKVAAHRAAMVAALSVSTLFLASYLYYHYHVGSVRFTGVGWIRPVYFTILISHVVLAVTILPLALVTVTRALRADFARHRRIARITLPLWVYVSVTGVVIYWMLYGL